MNNIKITGSRPVKNKEIKEYIKTMKEKVIPKIIETIERRRVAAARYRHRPLRC